MLKIILGFFGSWQGMLALYVGITLAVGSAELYVYNKGVDHGAESVQKKWDEYTKQESAKTDSLRAATQKGADAAETKALESLTKINLKLQGELQNEIKSNPAYNCVIPANGVRLYNQGAAD